MSRTLRIGTIGAGSMGTAHAVALRQAVLVFGSAPAVPEFHVLCDKRTDVAATEARRLGFARWTGDWREVVDDPEVDVVDLITTNESHPEIALAALARGKHVWCEKPLANAAADALAMTRAAEAAGLVTLVGYNYLRNPAVAYVRELIRAGELGEITLFRGTFDIDHMADPGMAFSWRHDRALAGTGALGDTGSHVLAFALALVGDIDQVVGHLATFIPERPVASSGSGQTARARGDEPRRAVENDDVCQFLLRFRRGAMGVIETSRIATGRKLWLTFEVQGSKGSAFFTQERMSEIQLYRAADPPAERGWKTVLLHPAHPGYAAFSPIQGNALGYADLKVLEARELLCAIGEGRLADPDFRFGWKVAQAVDAVERSARERRWVATAEV